MTTAADLKALIRDVPDFPKPGVLFRDITPLLLDKAAFAYVIDKLIGQIAPLDPDAIVGIESRGFLFGAPLAYKLGLPFVPVRKGGKLPSERMSVEFSLEYGESQLDIHTDALKRDEHAVIVDDLLATGGTANAACQLVELLGAHVDAVAFVVELGFVKGRERLLERKVISLVTYE